MKKSLLISVILFIIHSGSLFSQKEAAIWYFGNNAGLDFNSGAPVALHDMNFYIREGCSTISDAAGNMLFYTNGVKVFNRNHQEMPGYGWGIGGHQSSTNAAIIVPDPVNINKYYIFTTYEYGGNMAHSIIDMTAANGLGAVVSGATLATVTTEKLSAVKDANGTGYWIVTTKKYTNEILAFHLGPTGLNTTPVISSIGTAEGGWPNSGLGALKLSPNGKKLAKANMAHSQIELFDFDNATGIVSNRVAIQFDYWNRPYGIEFSPNSKVLYTAMEVSSGGVFQFDISNHDESIINNSKVVFNYGNPLGALQLGIDGKLYVGVQTTKLDVINEPNNLGTACNYQIGAVDISPGYGTLGLPAFVQSLFSTGFTYTNTCFNDITGFELQEQNIQSVIWNFDDPNAGASNQSNAVNPSHQFTAPGSYNVTVVVTNTSGQTTTITNTVVITAQPIAYSIQNIHACENHINTGISSNFDSSQIESQVLNGQTNMKVSYFDGHGNLLSSPLPSPLSNSIPNQETITVRVSPKTNPLCFSETTFDLIVSPIPNVNTIAEIKSCDDNNDGFTYFDLSSIENQLIGNQPYLDIEYYNGNNNLIPNLPTYYQNIIENQETITVKVKNTVTNCVSHSSFKLIVTPSPVVNESVILKSCDDNKDGISEYFDTSNLEHDLIGNQTGLQLLYFNSNGDLLNSPLPNPISNITPFNDFIKVIVTDTLTNCQKEANVQLLTTAEPIIHSIPTLYSCDEGNGYANFDTSAIQNQLIGNQTQISLVYTNESGELLPTPFPSNFQNQTPFEQTINVKVIDNNNPNCFSTETFKLAVNSLPNINLNDDYILCDLKPYLRLESSPSFDSWTWTYEDGTIVSTNYFANLIDEGEYTLTVVDTKNNISCENSKTFKLTRTVLPQIENVSIQEWSYNNSIEIFATGDGDFEYSINGINYQDQSIFSNVSGGIYTVHVRDKNGCGEDKNEVAVIDYPQFFTPNGNGINDYWQILGIRKYGQALIYIFDRYGKLLTKISPNARGWDGTYHGNPMPSDDYWFKLELNDGKTFKAHFTLKR